MKYNHRKKPRKEFIKIDENKEFIKKRIDKLAENVK